MPPRYSFTCTLPDCDRPFLASGLCRLHYKRWKRHGDPYGGRRLEERHLTADQRFLVRIQPQAHNGCWLWTAGRYAAGYGEFKVDGVDVYAHRWSYERFVGPIPEGFTVDHVCHTLSLKCFGGLCLHRRCTNPTHLEPVTIVENFRRGSERLTRMMALKDAP